MKRRKASCIGSLVGTWKEGRAVLLQHYLEIEPSDMHPAIMARITDIKALLEVIGLNDDAPEDRFQAVLSIKDPIIPENEGRWLWKLGKNGGTLERMIGLGLQTEADEAANRRFCLPVRCWRSTLMSLHSGSLGTGLEEISGVAPPFWTEYVRTLREYFWMSSVNFSKIEERIVFIGGNAYG